MIDLCLAEYPEKDSPIAFQIAAMQGEVPPLVNPMYATFISSMLRRSNVIDVQANILADLFRNGRVMRENVPHLRETLVAVDPADILATAVYRAHKAHRVTKRIADIMHRIQEQVELQHVSLLDKNGLYVETVEPNGGLPLYLDDNFSETFGEDSLTENTALRLNLNAWAYQKELVWRRDDQGSLQAILLSDLDHHALGVMDYEGNFEHVVTVLSPEHPIRAEGLELDY